MQIAVLGIDLGKNSCSVVGLDLSGQVVLRRRMRRRHHGFVASPLHCRHGGLLRSTPSRSAARCSGPHDPPDVAGVRAALCEGAEERRPGCRSDRRGGDPADHAFRRAEERGTTRSAVSPSGALALGDGEDHPHQPAILLERGFAIPKGRRALNEALAEILVDPSDRISGRMRQLVGEMQAERQALDERVTALDRELLQRARADEAARRLVTIPGIGALNATALLAAVGDASAFRRGRDLAAWLGLVPRQQTSGGRPKLLGITKRGNKYLRMLFIHGARAAMPWLAKTPTPLGAWLRGLISRAHRNVATVALANKLARIAWAMLRRGSSFDSGRLAGAA